VISKQHFINKIRELGYTFKRQADRVDLWRKKGGTHYIAVPRSDQLEDEFVSSSLRQAGCTRDDILNFISAAKS
jgi:hypothetical protein